MTANQTNGQRELKLLTNTSRINWKGNDIKRRVPIKGVVTPHKRKKGGLRLEASQLRSWKKEKKESRKKT